MSQDLVKWVLVNGESRHALTAPLMFNSDKIGGITAPRQSLLHLWHGVLKRNQFFFDERIINFQSRGFCGSIPDVFVRDLSALVMTTSTRPAKSQTFLSLRIADALGGIDVNRTNNYRGGQLAGKVMEFLMQSMEIWCFRRLKRLLHRNVRLMLRSQPAPPMPPNDGEPPKAGSVWVCCVCVYVRVY
jgi:hypothetical protein